jgi:hypothetical protein
MIFLRPFQRGTNKILLLLFLVLSWIPAFTQPGGGGGLQITEIHDFDSRRIPENDTALQIKCFVLSEKKHHVKEELPLTNRHRYKPAHIYLPPLIRTPKKDREIPNLRLQLIYKQDTMIIDIIGIPGENGNGDIDIMERIEFIPGYFKCFRSPHISHPDLWNDEGKTERHRIDIIHLLQSGISNSTILPLSSIGLLQHIPDPDEKGKEIRRRRLECIDSSYNLYDYYSLCYHMISINDSMIEISSKAKPVQPDSFLCYKFMYYYINRNRINQADKITMEEGKLAYTTLEKIKTSGLKINGKPFTGCVKIASMFFNRGLRHYSGFDLLVLYYDEGKILKHRLIPDVSLNDERGHIRIDR